MIKTTKQILKKLIPDVKNLLEIRKNKAFTSQSFQTKTKFINFINSASDALLDVLDNLIYLDDRYYTVNPSQSTLGIKAGICRQYTNVMIKELVDAGLLRTENHGYKQTLHYNVHPLLFRTDFRIALRDFLPALRHYSLKALLIHDPTLSLKRDNNIFILRNKSVFYKKLKKIISTFLPSALKKFYEDTLKNSIMYSSQRELGLSSKTHGAIPPVRMFTPPVRLIRAVTKCHGKKDNNQKSNVLLKELTPKQQSVVDVMNAFFKRRTQHE